MVVALVRYRRSIWWTVVVGVLLAFGDARWRGVVAQVDAENEGGNGGADEESSTPLAIRSVEIYVDERPDFSFLSSPELYMFCLPNGGPNEQISDYLKEETSKDRSPLSLLASPAAADYLRSFGAVAAAIPDIFETDTIYDTNVNLGTWPVYPSFFPSWLKSEIITNEDGVQIVYALRCEIWEWDAFSGNEYYGSSVIPITAFTNGVTSVSASFTSDDTEGGAQVAAQLTIECDTCEDLLPANDAVDEGECMGRLAATNDSCGLVIFPSAPCCTSMRNFVNRYCYCVDTVVQSGGLLLQARKALQAQCNFSPLFEDSDMCPANIIRISPPPPPLPLSPPPAPDTLTSSPPIDDDDAQSPPSLVPPPSPSPTPNNEQELATPPPIDNGDAAAPPPPPPPPPVPAPNQNVENIPVIAIVGKRAAKFNTIELNAFYIDEGATATDEEDGDLSESIVVTSMVDTSTPGDYVVSYDVTDSDGNSAVTRTRIVRVLDTDPSTSPPPPPPPPPIDDDADEEEEEEDETLSSSSPPPPPPPPVPAPNQNVENIPVIAIVGKRAAKFNTVDLNALYIDEGATATDEEDGDLSESIVVTSMVDTSTPGDYVVSYDVTDSDGNSAVTRTRIVRVLDTDPSTSPPPPPPPPPIDDDADEEEEEEDETLSSSSPPPPPPPPVPAPNQNVENIPVIAIVGKRAAKFNTVELNAFYIDEGATATDEEDGDLSESIVVTSMVDTSTPGDYVVSYDVTDSDGNNAVTRTRIVRVLDTDPSTSPPPPPPPSPTPTPTPTAQASPPPPPIDDDADDDDEATGALPPLFPPPSPTQGGNNDDEENEEEEEEEALLTLPPPPPPPPSPTPSNQMPPAEPLEEERGSPPPLSLDDDDEQAVLTPPPSSPTQDDQASTPLSSNDGEEGSPPDVVGQDIPPPPLSPTLQDQSSPPPTPDNQDNIPSSPPAFDDQAEPPSDNGLIPSLSPPPLDELDTPNANESLDNSAPPPTPTAQASPPPPPPPIDENDEDEEDKAPPPSPTQGSDDDADDEEEEEDETFSSSPPPPPPPPPVPAPNQNVENIPVIAIVGKRAAKFNTVELNAFYIDEGATATDEEDGDLSESIVVTSMVDTSTPGDYVVSYDVTDSDGNSAVTRTRIVRVLDTDPSTSPPPPPPPSPTPTPTAQASPPPPPIDDDADDDDEATGALPPLFPPPSPTRGGNNDDEEESMGPRLPPFPSTPLLSSFSGDDDDDDHAGNDNVGDGSPQSEDDASSSFFNSAAGAAVIALLSVLVGGPLIVGAGYYFGRRFAGTSSANMMMPAEYPSLPVRGDMSRGNAAGARVMAMKSEV